MSGTNLLMTLEGVQVHLFPSLSQQRSLENVLRSFNDQIFVNFTCIDLVTVKEMPINEEVITLEILFLL